MLLELSKRNEKNTDISLRSCTNDDSDTCNSRHSCVSYIVSKYSDHLVYAVVFLSWALSYVDKNGRTFLSNTGSAKRFLGVQTHVRMFVRIFPTETVKHQIRNLGSSLLQELLDIEGWVDTYWTWTWTRTSAALLIEKGKSCLPMMNVWKYLIYFCPSSFIMVENYFVDTHTQNKQKICRPNIKHRIFDFIYLYKYTKNLEYELAVRDPLKFNLFPIPFPSIISNRIVRKFHFVYSTSTCGNKCRRAMKCEKN